MAKTSKKGEERKLGIVMLRLLVEKLQRGLSQSKRLAFDDGEEEEEVGGMEAVPADVKEGHFAVFAVKGGKPKRFIVELDYLSNPEFLRLLEQAEEEFGFNQKGALAVPCRPDDLQRILGGSRKEGNAGCGDGCSR